MGFLKNIGDWFCGKMPEGILRSPGWSALREEHLKQFPACIVCGETKKREVHHIVPVHIDRSKELDKSNLATLCESKKHGVNCHLWFGHLGKYTNMNKDVIADSKIWSEKLSKA